MRGVSWSVDAYQLKSELATILHSPPYEHLSPKMNFHVSLKRDKRWNRPHAGFGFLTLPTLEIGQKFLDEYGGLSSSKRFNPQGRVITFSQGNRENCNAEILEGITRLPYIEPQQQKESEERASRLRSRAIIINSVQFGWDCRDDIFSIEWETVSHRASTLSFDPERSEIRVTLVEIGRAHV